MQAKYTGKVIIVPISCIYFIKVLHIYASWIIYWAKTTHKQKHSLPHSNQLHPVHYPIVIFMTQNPTIKRDFISIWKNWNLFYKAILQANLLPNKKEIITQLAKQHSFLFQVFQNFDTNPSEFMAEHSRRHFIEKTSELTDVTERITSKYHTTTIYIM